MYPFPTWPENVRTVNDVLNDKGRIKPVMYRRLDLAFEPYKTYTAEDLYGTDERTKIAAAISYGRCSGGDHLLSPNSEDYWKTRDKGLSSQQEILEAHRDGVLRALRSAYQKLVKDFKRNVEQSMQEHNKFSASEDKREQNTHDLGGNGSLWMKPGIGTRDTVATILKAIKQMEEWPGAASYTYLH